MSEALNQTATPRFITLEGGEGAGKTTCLNHVVTSLQAAGKEVLVTREPGGTPLGEHLRGLLLGHEFEGMATDTEILLMFAARAEHWHKVIAPALQAGQWVVCDRFVDASYAYQSGGRGVPATRIAEQEQWLLGERRPDMTLLLDLPVETGMQRAAQRSAPDRFESEHLAFFERVRACYRQRAKDDPQRFRVVDASQTLDIVLQQIDRVLKQALDEVPG